MMYNDKLVLLLNVRLSEREPTAQGRRLDRIVGLPQSSQAALKSMLVAAATEGAPVNTMQRSPARFTAIMRSQFGAVFNACYRLRVPASSPLIDLNMEGVQKIVAVHDVFASFSASHSAAGVEGDDLLFCIVVGPAPQCRADFTLHGRPTSYAEAVSLLGHCVPDLLQAGLGRFQFGGLPGFYLVDTLRFAVDGKPEAEEVDAYVLSQDGNPAIALVSSYLFYCWLICQRAERLLNSISFEGDGDLETRKFILTRKKVVAGMRFALLKNRAEPDSPVLPIFFGLLKKLRLEEQLSNLASLAEEMQKAIETKESYLANNRLQKIELILFLSAILGLGVGLNAIQMPPFFDAGTKNVLLSPTFWVVFGGVIGGSLLIWGWLENWKRARRWSSQILDRLTRRKTV